MTTTYSFASGFTVHPGFRAIVRAMVDETAHCGVCDLMDGARSVNGSRWFMTEQVNQITGYILTRTDLAVMAAHGTIEVQTMAGRPYYRLTGETLDRAIARAEEWFRQEEHRGEMEFDIA